MVMFNYSVVLVFVVVLCIIRESRALMNDVLLMMSWYGVELVLISPVTYLWKFGVENSSNILLANWWW